MNNKAFKFAYFTLLMTLTISQGFAQLKTGCEPKSCGPDNTKVAEAKVITELRSELETVIMSMKNSSIFFSTEITSFEVPAGSSDDESVLFIAQAAAVVRAELVERLPESILMHELRHFRPDPASSKQQVLKNVKIEVSLLTEQVSKI
ncbi:hypothetical protein C900_03901 [Fulvivirga imtechensis AK7]|uniref:Uncharacterized protein n=1 Tax=Fulvivirga imtechensis AK7 TaxID=1237149 RepID=L8JMR4_9BACT|nr:hypothetical protein [Fulvivirga imtechensis]ELR70216.1 hypothetical protein C900_03901 [Fulvivirga imtechensis AK7]